MTKHDKFVLNIILFYRIMIGKVKDLKLIEKTFINNQGLNIMQCC